MAQTFGITLNQVLMMFIFLLIGYFAKKGKLLNDSAGGVISNLLVWVFLPAMCFNTFATQFNITSLFKNINFVIIGTFVMIFEIALGFLWAKLMTKDKFERGVYAYTVMFPNYTYFGYPLILALYGEEWLYYAMMFMLVGNIVCYVLGFYILDPTKTKLSFKSLLNPPIAATAVGIVFGIFGIKLPKVMSTAVQNAQNCMAPMSMILAGYVLSSLPLKKAFTNVRVYLTLFVRMVFIPFCTALALYLLGFDKTVIIISAGMMAMPAGLNSIVVPASKGLNSTLGACIALISNVAALIITPVAFMILAMI